MSQTLDQKALEAAFAAWLNNPNLDAGVKDLLASAIAAYLDAFPSPEGDAGELDRVADAINRARYVPGGLPEQGLAEEDKQSQEYSRRLARAAVAALSRQPTGEVAELVERVRDMGQRAQQTIDSGGRDDFDPREVPYIAEDVIAALSRQLPAPTGEVEPKGWYVVASDKVGYLFGDKEAAEKHGTPIPLYAAPVVASAKAGEVPYHPVIIRFDEGAFIEFVTEDVPTITGQMEAANVERIYRMNQPRELIGFRIYAAQSPMGEGTVGVNDA